jgi:hypothetical protein
MAEGIVLRLPVNRALAVGMEIFSARMSSLDSAAGLSCGERVTRDGARGRGLAFRPVVIICQRSEAPQRPICLLRADDGNGGELALQSPFPLVVEFSTANYSAAGERQECPPDFVPHLDKRALRSSLARCLPSRRRLLGKRRKLDTIAAQCLGAIERLICRGL